MTIAAADPHGNEPQYRRDIDGLRAVAVMAVVIFHALPVWLTGGFVGVDVFFVISGYLISGIIIRHLATGTFSYRDFYLRRIRRLFPALGVVLLATALLGWIFLLPDELSELGRHIVAGSLFVANIVYWTEADYFDRAASLKPLLHLWSLGIEEQFYIVWPIVLALAWKFRWRLGLVIVGGLVISLALNVYLVQRDPVSTFYLPFTRFWELLAGALIGYITWSRPRIASGLFASRGTNAALAALGLLLIVIPCLLYSKQILFPGWYAIVPVLGTSLVILSGPNNRVSQLLLGNRLAVYIGKISYPLYLWHWPLISMLAVVGLGQANSRDNLLAVCVAIVAAALTYHFVETPIRRARRVDWALRRAIIPATAALCAGVLILFAPAHLIRPGTQLSTASANDFVWPWRADDNCMQRFPFEAKRGWWFCNISDAAAPSVILLGNSHANHLYPGLSEHNELSNSSVLSIGSCDPTIGIRGVRLGQPCQGDAWTRQEAFLSDLLENQSPGKLVVFSNSWPTFDNNGRSVDYHTLAPAIAAEFNPVDPAEETLSQQDQFFNALLRRIGHVHAAGHRILFVLGTPRLPYDPRTCFARPFKQAANNCITTRDYQLDRQQTFRDGLKAALATVPHIDVALFDPLNVFCATGQCVMLDANGKSLMRDDDHLSARGSRVLSDALVPWLQRNRPEWLSH